MVAWLIGSAVRLRRLIVVVIVVVLGLGLVQLRNATVDVYPEFEPTVVQVQTEALGLSALEVEQLITVPLEHNLLNGIPRLEELRSRSMPGVSVVDLVFEPGTDLSEARQLTQERLTRVKLLPNVGQPPTMIQPTATVSRVAMIGLRSDTVSLVDMSVLARWHMRPRLMSIPGVAQVSIWGLRDRQLQVQVDPERLVASNVTLTQLIETTGNALWVSPLSFVQASTPGSGGFFESPNQRIGVQHISPVTTAEQLADVTVQRADGSPVRLGDIADVIEDHPPLIGDASSGGEQGLMLVVERFPDADVGQVSQDVDAALAAMSPGLTGISIDSTVFRPVSYLDTALGRLAIAVLVGLALMILVIAVVTLSWRVTLITLAAVLSSLTAALYVLHLRGSTLTTMTLLGLALVAVLVIDDAVGDAAEMRARIKARREADRSAARALIIEVLATRRSGLIYAALIALVAVAPLLLLDGTAGAFARPAVLSFALAALVGLGTALVLTPSLAVLLLGGTGADASRGERFAAAVRGGADRFVAPSVGRRLPILVAAVMLVGLVATGVALLRPGEPLPQLQDRSVMVRLTTAPGTSLLETDRISDRMAAELRTVPGVESAGSHVGRAVGADSIVDVDSGQIWITVADDADYTRTLEAIRSTVAGYPGLHSQVLTYTGAQVADVDADRTDDLVVRVSGQDFETLRQIAERVREALATVNGVISPVVEVQPVQPVLEVRVDLAAAQRHGVQPGDVRRSASTLVSGLAVGSLYEDQAIFEVVVWGGPAHRQGIDDLEAVRIDTPSGTQVRLGDVADVVLTSDPTVVSHHATARTLDVIAQVQGRDPADVARDATARLQQLTYPFEYRAEVVSDGSGGSGIRQELVWAAAVAVLLVFLLFQAATNSWRGATLLLVCVPLAGGGGLLAALMLGEVGSASVFAAVFAVVALATRQALVLVRRAHAVASGRDPQNPVEAMRGAVREQAPAVIAAVLVIAAAFVPAAVMGGGAGLEILHPFAVTLLAGLITVAVVVLFLVPVLYPASGALRPSGDGDDDLFAGPREARPEGVPVAAVPAAIPHSRPAQAPIEREGQR